MESNPLEFFEITKLIGNSDYVGGEEETIPTKPGRIVKSTQNHGVYITPHYSTTLYSGQYMVREKVVIKYAHGAEHYTLNATINSITYSDFTGTPTILLIFDSNSPVPGISEDKAYERLTVSAVPFGSY